MSQKQELTPWQDESTLRYLHHDKEKSTREIGELLGVSHATVWKYMVRHDIDRRVGKRYSDNELLEWIDAFVEFYGVVPRRNDIIRWPGPSPTPYQRCFGTFTEAVREAGYTPRSEL